MELRDVIALFVGVIILIGLIVYLIRNQRNKIIEWLKFAVVEAEKYLGEKTGQLKLRQVYDWYTEQFPIIAAILPFSVFSDWVDEALETMKNWMEGNKDIKNYIDGGGY